MDKVRVVKCRDCGRWLTLREGRLYFISGTWRLAMLGAVRIFAGEARPGGRHQVGPLRGNSVAHHLFPL